MMKIKKGQTLKSAEHMNETSQRCTKKDGKKLLKLLHHYTTGITNNPARRCPISFESMVNPLYWHVYPFRSLVLGHFDLIKGGFQYNFPKVLCPFLHIAKALNLQISPGSVAEI